MKVSIIGLGAVGKSIAEGIKNDYELHLSSGSYEKLSAWNKNRFKIYETNLENAKNGDIIILAVKPGNAEYVINEIREYLHNKLIISVMAGISIQYIKKYVKDAYIVRVMPNIPMIIQKSVNAFCFDNINDEYYNELIKILNDFGTPVKIKENYIDAVTGLSGSGPGFISIIMESMITAGIKLGIPKDVSRYLTIETFLGTANLMKDKNISPSELRDEVITPGGTTIAGIYELEKGNVRTAITNAVEASCKKAREFDRL